MRKLTLLLFVLGAPGCADEPSAPPPVARTHAPLRVVGPVASEIAASERPSVPSPARFPEEIVLEWGNGPGQVGLMPAREERPAFGPQSLAVPPGGGLYVLDAVNARVARLDADGRPRAVLPAPPGASDLVVGPDGQISVLSLVNRRVTVLDPARGDVVGSVGIPAPLRLVAGLTFDDAGRLLLINGRQETFTLGRPGAWTGWPDLLHTKAERPWQAVLRDGAAVLLENGSTDHLIRLAESDGAASVAVLDARPDGRAVVLLEWLTAGGSVRRAVQIHDAAGALLGRAIPAARPVAFPYRELAVGPGPEIYQLSPRRDGLHVLRLAFSARGEVSR